MIHRDNGQGDPDIMVIIIHLLLLILHKEINIRFRIHRVAWGMFMRETGMK